ncbi:MAG: response regulator, partial [Desulfocapsa sp.]|nr:response regulator [Desulfocapsa sp.]
AHDFNNILSAILGYTEIAKAQLPADNKIRNDLDQVIIAGQRATDLVKQILTFSRQSEELFKPLDVQVILTEVLKLLRSSLPSTISLKENISKDCDMVFANSTQIHQVIMNICTNAKDAIGEEIGTLEVSLSEIQFTKTNDIATYPQMANGSYLDIEIRDTGCGMNSSTQAKIFDPFYTTKERGKGTGIGLAVVHGIIKQHKGEITVTSEPGHGTTFHIYLPVIEHQETLEEQVVSQKLPLGNGERILFVDDEVSIISMMQITLSNLGYSVTVFDSSLEAFDAYQQNPEYFDIIITDMTMPQMTGLEMSKKLLEIQPDLPIILCTGFSETIDDIKAKSFGISAFINKPIHQLTLAKTIQKVLKKPEKA